MQQHTGQVCHCPAGRFVAGPSPLPLARLGVAALLIAALPLALPGCGSSPKPRDPIAVQPDLPDVPAVLRGLIGTETTFRNTTPTLISGFGIVVGLRGTGGLPLNDQLAASMERELGLQGLGRGNDRLRGTALEGKTASEVLRDPNVAVVEVLAAVEPGAPDGSDFDVQVRAINATSLEGGTLWTTELRLGAPTAFGQRQARRVGIARGPIFLNPFAQAEAAAVGFQGTEGRVLGGGTITDSFNVVIALNSPSHARARSIVSAINSRYPSGAGDSGDIARGRTDTNIELFVPARERTRPVEFLNVVRAIQIDQSSPLAYARRYVEGIKAQPELAEQLSWALEALGEQALPVTRELYDHPELVPQLAGLRAGARLGDPRAAAPLRELIATGQGTTRLEAIRLLAEVDGGPSIDLTLRDLLRESDLLVRVAAYEGLALRAERTQFRRLTNIQRNNPDRRRAALSPMDLENLARTSLPEGTIQGVSRTPVEGKFLLDRVPEGPGLVYVTQQLVPRVVIFGEDDRLRVGSVVSVWNGQFLLAVEEGGRQGTARVRWSRPGRRQALTLEGPASLSELAALLARNTNPTDPRPGAGMSYSEVVAVLSAIQESNAIGAAFATEQDRLNNQLLAAQNARDMLDRPETPRDRDAVLVRRGNQISTTPRPEEQAPSREPAIVPIVPTTPPRN